MSFNCSLCCLYVISSFFIINTIANNAIYGGVKAKEKDFPYQVSIQAQGKGHICGGGIIDTQFILTAAHCVVNAHGDFFNERLHVLAGTDNLHKINPSVAKIDVKKIYVPSTYIPWSLEGTCDIAILKLSHPLQYTEHIRKLELPPHKMVFYDKKVAKIVGFGWHWTKMHNGKEIGANDDGQLRQATADVINNNECQLGYHREQIFDKHICAKVRQHPLFKPSGICVGDSGGPLVYDGIAIGVLSYGPTGCVEESIASVYTRVSRYLTFIRNAMNDKIHDIRHHEFS